MIYDFFRHFPKEVLLEFIRVFKNRRSLWDPKCANYNNVEKIYAAKNKLLHVCKKVEPLATIPMVEKNIQFLKNVFKQEYSKVQTSRRAALTNEDVYVPKVWYYHRLKFLSKEEICSHPICDSSSSMENFDQVTEIDDVMESYEEIFPYVS